MKKDENKRDELSSSLAGLVEMIELMCRQTATKVVKKILSQEYEKYKDCKVVSVPDGGCEQNSYATVKVTGTNDRLEIVNKSGETLNAGDIVRVYISNDNISDSYIGMKR